MLCCSISVTFVSEKDGSETTVKAPIGQHLLEVAHKNDIELEGAPPSTPCMHMTTGVVDQQQQQQGAVVLQAGLVQPNQWQ